MPQEKSNAPRRDLREIVLKHTFASILALFILGFVLDPGALDWKTATVCLFIGLLVAWPAGLATAYLVVFWRSDSLASQNHDPFD